MTTILPDSWWPEPYPWWPQWWWPLAPSEVISAEATALSFYLIPLKPEVVLTGRVNGALSDPWVSVGYDGATADGQSLAGNSVWFGSAAGLRDRCLARLRTASIASGTTSGTLLIGEDNTSRAIEDNDYITIKREWRLWPKYPRFVATSDTEVTIYEDYDIAYTDQTVNWKPVAVGGPPGVAFLSGGFAIVYFVGDQSFPLAPGGSVSSYLWTAEGSIEGTSSSAGSDGAPVSFTWTSEGQYLVTLEVTDSNSKTHTYYVWVWIVDQSNPAPIAYTSFDAVGESSDFQQGGGECSFTVYGDATIDDFPAGTMIVLACDGTLATATGSWPYRTNILFVGYILENSIRQDPHSGDVSFRAATINQPMSTLTMWPVSMDDMKGPADWTQAKDITVDRANSFLWHWRSTLADICSIVPLGYNALMKSQRFGPEDMFSSLSQLLANAWGKVIVNHQGVLYFEMDYQQMTDAEQGAVTTRKTLHKGIWLGNVDIEEKALYGLPVNQVKMDGVFYPGDEAEAVPMFSEAPGSAPRVFGREGGGPGYIVANQDDLNTRCGRLLARENIKRPVVRMQFVNDGAFTIAPQEVFPAVIESGDNDRALSWSPLLVPRRISRTFNHEGGYMLTEVEFEPSTTGIAGLTVTMPTEPPDDKMPPWDAGPSTPWTPPADPEAGPMMAADSTASPYYSPVWSGEWEHRAGGLETDELVFKDMITDPWWKYKTGGVNPEQSIVHACGPGFIVISNDGAKNWTAVTGNLPDPENTWGDAAPPTVEDLTFVQMAGDMANEGTFYAIAEYQGDSSEWRGYLYRTDDNWKTASCYEMGARASGTAQWCYLESFVEGSPQYTNTQRSSLPPCAAEPPASGTLTIWNEDNFLGPQDGECVRMRTDWDDRSALNCYWSGFSYLGIYDFGFWFELDTATAVTDPVWGDINFKFRTGQVLNNTVTNDYLYVEFTDSPDYPTSGGRFVVMNTVPSGTVTYGSGETTINYYRYLRMFWHLDGYDQNPAEDQYGDIELDFSAIYPHALSDQIRPLGISVSQDGRHVHVTNWEAESVLLRIYRVADSLAIPWRTEFFGDASIAEINAKTYYGYPHASRTPGETERIYVFGRFDMSGAKHVYVSADNGENWSNIGDGAWTSERVGAFFSTVASTNVLIALLNDGSTLELWKSADGGSSWSLASSQADFTVENHCADMHWGTNGVIVAVDFGGTGSVYAVVISSPYTSSFTDVTGSPALPGDTFSSIFWI